MGRVFIQTFEHSNIQTFLNSQLHHSQLHHYLLCLFTFKKNYLPPCAGCGIYDILRITFTEHGVVAQLVSALDCRSGGCGFEPRRPRQYGKHAGLPRGVMVAPQILILLVGVRVPARQPLNFPLTLNRYLALYCQFATFFIFNKVGRWSRASSLACQRQVVSNKLFPKSEGSARK